MSQSLHQHHRRDFSIDRALSICSPSSTSTMQHGQSDFALYLSLYKCGYWHFANDIRWSHPLSTSRLFLPHLLSHFIPFLLPQYGRFCQPVEAGRDYRFPPPLPYDDVLKRMQSYVCISCSCFSFNMLRDYRRLMADIILQAISFPSGGISML